MAGAAVGCAAIHCIGQHRGCEIEVRQRGIRIDRLPREGALPRIGGAGHRFWKEGLREDGRWKSPDEQQQRFQALPPKAEIIVDCGSGVTACPNVLAQMEAGFQNVKLYSGSWSDWISYSDNPIATGEE